jgi:TetR/AcrR family transcriptional regulator, mexJK operon transcriptional repressor
MAAPILFSFHLDGCHSGGTHNGTSCVSLLHGISEYARTFFMTTHFKPPATPNGRPTKEQAEQRQEQLLDRALEMFLEKGFELTTIDAIAASLSMTKRTIYSRYQDKRALFRAAVQRAVDQWIVPVEVLRAADTGDLQATLLEIARIRVSNNLSPAGLRLQRIINAESFRFPEILKSYEEGALPTIEFLADLFRRHEGRELGKLEDPVFDAQMFLSMVAASSRIVVLGKPPDKAAIGKRTRKCVQLFLDGLRTRPGRPSE